MIFLYFSPLAYVMFIPMQFCRSSSVALAETVNMALCRLEWCKYNSSIEYLSVRPVQGLCVIAAKPL